MKRYAKSTIVSYTNCLLKFLTAFRNYKLEEVNEKNIETAIKMKRKHRFTCKVNNFNRNFNVFFS